VLIVDGQPYSSGGKSSSLMRVDSAFGGMMGVYECGDITTEQLMLALLEKWDAIPQARLVRRVIQSMRHRCEEVIVGGGGATRF